jgi:hypothetical protein
VVPPVIPARRVPPVPVPREGGAPARRGDEGRGPPFLACVHALVPERGARGGPASTRLNERDNVRSSGISRSDGVERRLPLILRLQSHIAKPD